MVRGMKAAAAALLGILLLASCHGAGGGGALPRLKAGTPPPAATVRAVGMLAGDEACPGVNTVVIWLLDGSDRQGSPGINTIVIWPRSAKVERRRDGNGTTVIVWPRTIGSGTPVRLGERVELIGDMKDDILGLALERPAPPGCRGPAFVVREFRPAPPSDAGELHFPRLREGFEPPAATARASGVLTVDKGCPGINGVVVPVGGNERTRSSEIDVVVVWPRAARFQPGGDGGGEPGINAVVVWCLAGGSCSPIRVGERIELTGSLVDDLATLPLEGPSACRGRAFVARDLRRLP
jgi:hypothetical protein